MNSDDRLMSGPSRRLFLASAAWGQEQAFTNRSTELKDLGSPSGKTLATLPENTSVKVIARGGD